MEQPIDDIKTNYRVIERLSQRDSTSVFLCENRATREFVIVKRSALVAAESTSPSPESRHRVTVAQGSFHPPIVLEMGKDSMEQEYKVAQLLRATQASSTPPTGIVRFVDARTVASTSSDTAQASVLFLTMEYCINGDLFSRLEQHPDHRIDEQDALRYFRQVVQGVHHLHTVVGVAHRDISLENVLLDAQDSAKICDFGLSVDSKQRCRDVVGKLQYMAPEVVAGDEYDPVLADVWSLGAMLFIMVTGSPLFAVAVASDPAWNALQRVGISGILAHWGLADNVSQQTTALLSAMLSLDSTKRPQSLRDVLTRLGEP